MVPHYAKLLLSSDAILPVLIIDGTFQNSLVRGTMIIAMIVSSNRTDIPVGWAWSPEENSKTIEMLLNLIKEINSKIETIITDDGIELKSAIKFIFPDTKRKLCAWNLAKSISDIFWKLVKSDPLIFRFYLTKLMQLNDVVLSESNLMLYT